MAQLPIHSLTLFKQGIGAFARRGTVNDQTVSLIVPRASLNDVLKSLDVTVHAGGPVQSVDYETPADKTQVLDTLAVTLSDRAGLVDLLTSLRGSTVTVARSDSAAAIRGRVIGVEATLPEANQPATLVLHHDESIQVIPLADVRELILHDANAANDVRFFLDISRTEHTRTALTVRLGTGSHDLELRYTAPSPTWRVSYRLVGDGQGNARLIGWGLFDNTLEEDLDDVQLTLISGRPVSFTYDLVESRIPSRPQVSDDPTTLEQIAGDRQSIESISALSHELRTPLTSIRGHVDLFTRGFLGPLSDEQQQVMGTLRQQTQRMLDVIKGLLDIVRLRDTDTLELPQLYRSGPLGDLKVSSSYFLPVEMGNAEPSFLTYTVATPVSVRRGQSALVPIIDASVAYEELCVYNAAKMTYHPLRVWRLRNTSGVALEQGPVTVRAEERYLGDGVMRFTGVGDEIQIPYALEFGVLIRQETDYPPRSLAQVHFNAEQRRAEVAWYHITRTVYRLTSNISQSVEVLLEHRDAPQTTYYEMPAPAFAAEGHTRWRVTVPAGAHATFTVQERQIRIAYEQITDWTSETLEELHAGGGLSATAYGRLQQLLTLAQEERDATAQQQALENDTQRLMDTQDQLRKNLAALGTSEREVSIRNRMLDDLEASEEQRRTIATTRTALDQQAVTRAITRQALIAEIYALSAGA